MKTEYQWTNNSIPDLEIELATSLLALSTEFELTQIKANDLYCT